MKINNCYIADFETTTANTEFYKKNEDVKVLLWCVSPLKNKYPKILGTSIESFWKHLKSKNCNLTVFFHNLSFDGDYLLKYLVSIGFKIVNYDYLIKNNTISVCRLNGVIYSFDVYFTDYKDGKKYDRCITFKCSLRLLNASINVLGKSYNINKHLDEEDSSFYDIEPEDDISKYPKRFIEYIKNDVEIARLALSDFMNMIRSLDFVSWYEKYTGVNFNPFNYLTSASLSFRLMKMYLFKLDKEDKLTAKPVEYLYIPAYQHLEISKYYHGGFSQFNTKYQHHNVPTHNMLMIDVNSAYPYQMSQLLPYGEMLSGPPKNSPYCTWVEVDVSSAVIDDKYFNIPILFNWTKTKFYDTKRKAWVHERYVKELHNFKCYYLKEEWDLINQFYKVKINNIRYQYQKTFNYLSGYCNMLFDLKKEFKATGNKGFQNAVKILLNAGYGVFGKRLKFDLFHYYDEKLSVESINEKLVDAEVHNECKNLKIHHLNCYRLDDMSDLKDHYLNKSLAAYVCAKQRVYLIKKIISVKNPNKKFALCDTDSVLFCNLTDQELKDIKSSLGSNLGEWDLEFDGNLNISIFGSKKYCISDVNNKIHKFRFAGVNNKDFAGNPLLANWDEDAIIVNNASLEVVRCKSGILLKPKDKKIWRGLN